MKIVEKRKSWIRFDGVVRLDPRKCLFPGGQLANCLLFVVDKTAGLEIVVVEDVANLLSLLSVKDTVIVPLKEVDGIRL